MKWDKDTLMLAVIAISIAAAFLIFALVVMGQ